MPGVSTLEQSESNLTSSVGAGSGHGSLEGGDLGGLLFLQFLDALGLRRRSNRHVVGRGSGEQALSILEGKRTV